MILGQVINILDAFYPHFNLLLMGIAKEKKYWFQIGFSCWNPTGSWFNAFIQHLKYESPW